jgi:hypothetical protein
MSLSVLCGREYSIYGESLSGRCSNVARVRRGAWSLTWLLAVSAMVAGCGASRRGEPLRRLIGAKAELLASERVPDGYDAIFGDDREHQGQMYLSLSAISKRKGGRGLRAGRSGMVVTGESSGLVVGPHEHRPLVLAGAGECNQNHGEVLAYGIVNDVRDVVSAIDGNVAIVLKKAVIPANLHATGILVYAIVPPGSSYVVTFAPNGRVSMTQPFRAGGCRGK